MTRRRALVVAPGRGAYNAAELGYLGRHHASRAPMLAEFDAVRKAVGLPGLAELDGAARFGLSRHGRGDNAAALIHASAFADFQAIDREKFEIVAITGNSMGWYIALAAGGALAPIEGFRLVNAMAGLMQETMIGGQLLYPVVDRDWHEIPGQRAEIMAMIEQDAELFLSIDLGGMLVLAGEDAALARVVKRLPPIDGRFPMRLANHAAFHSPLQAPVSARAGAALSVEMFRPPEIPLIDGRGHVWFPFSSDPADLREYTLGHQVVAPYDFSRAVRNGLCEFAPDVVIVLGPGRSLSGAVAQTLTGCNWRSLADKADFQARNRREPILLSMGIDDERRLAATG